MKSRCRYVAEFMNLIKTSVEKPPRPSGKRRNKMATQYSIGVSLNNSQLSQFSTEKLALKVFKGVQSESGGGALPVWLNIGTADISANMSITWSEQYGGYIDKSQGLVDGAVVDANNALPMDLGELLLVDKSSALSLATGGAAGEITVSNQSVTPWICGMGQEVTLPDGSSKLQPTCAFPLNGTFYVSMLPYEKILMVFESSQTDTGSVIEATTSSTIIVTLSGTNPAVAVYFDINTGWDAKRASWAQINDNGYTIADQLIVPPSS
jgi:hypothetical protein